MRTTNFIVKMRSIISPARLARRDPIFFAALIVLFVIAQSYFPAHR